VTRENILVVEPKPRNPLLADAFKRIGLAERTGRGVDLIYRGLLGNGRPAPSYTRSGIDAVVLEMSCGEADLSFVEMIVAEENRTGARLPIDALLVLDLLRRERRVEVELVARTIQKDISAARGVLERLVEAGFVAAAGVKKGRTYTMSAQVYRRLGQAEGFARQAGFEPIQQEEMVKRYVREHGEIRRKDVMGLCRLSGPQATRLLGRLTRKGSLRRVGTKRWTRYEPGSEL
jgi:ATP-dependent DNA helicase RecG